MSAEEASAQENAQDKAQPQAPKAAATFSSFINKNTTGKKFAPKAARRRPGAAPAAPAAPAPSTAAPEPAPEPSLAPATEPFTPAQLPTPAATQEPTVPQAIISTLPSSTATAVPSPSQGPSPSTTASTHVQGAGQAAKEPEHVAHLPLDPDATPRRVEDAPDISRASKRRRVVPPAPKSTAAAPQATVTVNNTGVPSNATPREDTTPGQQQSEVQSAIGLETSSIVASGNQAEENGAVQPEVEAAVVPQPRKRRKLPWVAVNHPQDDHEEPSAILPAKKNRRPARTRGKQTAAMEEDIEDPEQQGDNDDVSQPTRTRPSAKARGKRKAASAPTEIDGDIQPPPKRTRRPRKAKGAETLENGEAAEETILDVDDGEEHVVVRRKPRQPRRKKQVATEGEIAEGEGAEIEEGVQKKRKGRPPREATPSDAEDHTIDPEVTYMDSLATRNVRVGKLSNREKEMRTINWEEVRQRRREEDCRPIQSKEEQEAADKALVAAGVNLEVDEHTERGPRFHTVDGHIRLVEESGTINREAAADRAIEQYQTIEDRDITSRITSRSFLKNNKRFPNDFILPGQGKRWNTDSTDLFYQGLKNFGTDFQMISHMFPGTTRRSIKTKFTREERDDPERVRSALQGRSEMVSHWDVFLHASQMKEESFADADEIKRQLAEDEAIMREKITAAKEETRLRNAQKAAAGLLDDENDDPNAINKENSLGKKKRKGKDGQVTIEKESGVEILGTIDDDSTWGQE